jgi:hypothetical protein
VGELDWTHATWRKSTRSGDGADCVEWAIAGNTVGVRHSKHPAGPILTFPIDAWRDFIAALKHGDFEQPKEPV